MVGTTEQAKLPTQATISIRGYGRFSFGLSAIRDVVGLLPQLLLLVATTEVLGHQKISSALAARQLQTRAAQGN